MRERVKVALYAGGIILSALAAIAAFESPTGAWPLCVMAVAAVAFANIDRFSEVSAGLDGVKAVVRDAQNQIEQYRNLAKLTAAASLSLVQRAGRLGGFSDDEKESFLRDSMRILNEANIESSELAELRRRHWDRFVDFDYVTAILGHNTVPNTSDQDLIAEWKSLRDFRNVATPDQVEAFLTKTGSNDGLRKDLLHSYRYYFEHREHGNPEVWRRRSEVKRLLE